MHAIVWFVIASIVYKNSIGQTQATKNVVRYKQYSLKRTLAVLRTEKATSEIGHFNSSFRLLLKRMASLKKKDT